MQQANKQTFVTYKVVSKTISGIQETVDVIVRTNGTTHLYITEYFEKKLGTDISVKVYSLLKFIKVERV